MKTNAQVSAEADPTVLHPEAKMSHGAELLTHKLMQRTSMREKVPATPLPYVLILCVRMFVCEPGRLQHKRTDVHSAVCRRVRAVCHGMCASVYVSSSALIKVYLFCPCLLQHHYQVFYMVKLIIFEILIRQMCFLAKYVLYSVSFHVHVTQKYFQEHLSKNVASRGYPNIYRISH